MHGLHPMGACAPNAPFRPNITTDIIMQKQIAAYRPQQKHTVGDCNTSRPGMMDFKGKAKWDAWNGKKGVSQDDIFIAVKTAGIFHNTRLSPILDTWHRNAEANTFFFTDTEDKELERRLPAGHLINTGCPGDHSRTALSCKMEAELTAFLTTSTADWFCHIDDDNYLNVDKLVEADTEDTNEFFTQMDMYQDSTKQSPNSYLS
mgnify:CR=1 FL=1